MPVQLKDAEIKVRLDLGDAEKAASVEERTKRQRKEEERDRQRKKDRDRREERRGKKRVGIGRIVGVSALAGAIKSLVRAGTSIPYAGMLFGAMLAGMGAAELNERFGPAFRGILKEALPDAIKNIPGMEQVLGMSADLAAWWPEVKAKVTSLGTAYQQTKAIGAALAITGGDLSAELVAEIFGEERAYAMHKILLEKQKNRLRMELIGGAIGKAMIADTKKVMENSLESGVNR